MGVMGVMGVSPSPNKLLDDYDLQTWNAHIYELSDCKYQKKLVGQLDIPNKNTQN
jgi:hypothetical protein